MNRRGFLFGGTTLLVAPSIVRASSLMKISTPPRSYMSELAYSFVETKEIYGANVLNQESVKQMLTYVSRLPGYPEKFIIKPTHIIISNAAGH